MPPLQRAAQLAGSPAALSRRGPAGPARRALPDRLAVQHPPLLPAGLPVGALSPKRNGRYPGVVDDAVLGMDVNGPVLLAADRVERAGQQPAPLAVGLHQRSELASRIVSAVVGLGRKDEDQAELGRWRSRELLTQHRQDLRRPEELILEVHKTLRGSQAAQVRLEAAEFYPGQVQDNAVRGGSQQLNSAVRRAL